MVTLSVVIPTYNEARDIAGALDSLQSQTVLPDEIIIVDNNCSDSTVQIASNYPLVKIVKESHPGITYARTTGFNAAQYDIIARTDADTIMAPNWVEKITAHFDKDASLVGITGRVASRELSPNGHFWFSTISALTREVARIYMRYNRQYPLMVGHNMAVRRSAWQKVASKVHLGDSQINEDVDVSLFIQDVGKVTYCRDVLVKTRLIEMFFNIPKLIRYGRTIVSTIKLHDSEEI